MTDNHVHDSFSSEKRLSIVLVFTTGFMFVEIIVGLISNSLALLSDAGHMANDVFSLALALIAIRLGRRRKNLNFTYGYKRFETIAAFINGLALWFIAIYVVWEAINRFKKLEELTIDGGLMMYGAVAGLLINIAGIQILRSAHEQNLNMKAAIQHVLADLLGSVGAVVSAIGVILFNWVWLDLFASLVISLLIFKSGYSILKQSGKILIESSPEDLKTKDLLFKMHQVPGVQEIHDFHAWKLTEQNNLITAHFLVDERMDIDQIRMELEEIAKVYGFNHVTFQIEKINCMDEDGNCVMKEEGFISHT